MNHSLANIELLSCVVLISIAFSLFIQQIDSLDTDTHRFFANNKNKAHVRISRSNQNDQNNITISNIFQSNNQLQQYNPSKPNSNNVQLHQTSISNSSNVSQTSSSTAAPSTSNTPTPSSFSQSSITNHTSTSYLGVPTTHTSNGPYHQTCHGRIKLNNTRGYVTDGHGNYSINVQCTWLVDSETNNSTIRLRFSEFNTECNYDYLYIFDGNSIYSPLVAAFSGFMKPSKVDNLKQYSKSDTTISATSSDSDISNNNSGNQNSNNSTKDGIIKTESGYFDEIVINSGRAFIYFHSDTAQSMLGFNLTYTINSCPYDCSNRGSCDMETLTCTCDSGFKGEGCQFEMCPNNCSIDKQNGKCDKAQGKCICAEGYSGLDCSKTTAEGVWTSIENESLFKLEGRSFHQAVVIDDEMWIVGGKTGTLTNFNSKNQLSHTIDKFNLMSGRWEMDRQQGKIGQDNLAELFGHTTVTKDRKIYIFGGMLPNSTVSNMLIILDTTTMLSETYVNKKSDYEPIDDDEFVAPIGVLGHSATLVGHEMYIFFGYNPIYGFLDIVQKYNILENIWTIVDTKGSSVTGSIGHSSVYDDTSKIIFIYGGHHSYKSNSLYSYDPYQDTFRLLQPGPHPRYYHRSMIVNGLMVVIGGNSYNASSSLEANDDCFDSHTLVYHLDCASGSYFNHYSSSTGNYNNDNLICDNSCWQVMNDPIPGVLQRYGHSVIEHNSTFFMFGGFNGIMLNTLHKYTIPDCLDYSDNDKDCKGPKLGVKCDWNRIKNSCHPANSLRKQTFNQSKDSSLMQIASTFTTSQDIQCSSKLSQSICESRQTCKDCLYTNFGCTWCGNGQCSADKCKSLASNPKAIVDPSLCHGDDVNANNNFLGDLATTNMFTYKETIMQPDRDLATELECRRYVNCYLCQSKSYCNWKGDHCLSLPPVGPLPTPTTWQSQLNAPTLAPANDLLLTNHSNQQITTSAPINMTKTLDVSPLFPNATISMILDNLTSNTSSSPFSIFQKCESPCFRRKSCKECIANKCIWCDTSNECIDSSAYFAYYPIGQCMHYVAHLAKCLGTSCSEIETCDQCQKNPKCGWLDDGSNKGVGQCLDGSSSGPLLSAHDINETISTALIPIDDGKKWHFYDCPLCQCNGHSTCRPGSSICQKSCTGHTEGNHCEKCIPGYYGNPLNGGVCKECKCNGHANTCNKDTGKCHCSTKGMIGHSCNKCDDQNHYIGDPTSAYDGSCYYNLTTDYHYTFNLTKADDYFYSDINFMNIPNKKDVDVDFTITCSRLALVNITFGSYGISYRYALRRSLHTLLECGSFRLKFPYDELLPGLNNTFYVHVYRFQTPFVLEIAFRQHRTLDLWQFFFTFSSCFLFLFVMAGVVWKLKQKYDLYRRRQQHVIEMEQMASRPFTTILLELTGNGIKSASSADLKLKKHLSASENVNINSKLTDTTDGTTTGRSDCDDVDLPRTSRSTSRASLDKFHDVDYHKLIEAPSPLSIEPCASGNAGILSLFVQLPGRPNLAIGSALVSLGDESSNSSSNNLGNLYPSNANGNTSKTGGP